MSGRKKSLQELADIKIKKYIKNGFLQLKILFERINIDNIFSFPKKESLTDIKSKEYMKDGFLELKIFFERMSIDNIFSFSKKGSLEYQEIINRFEFTYEEYYECANYLPKNDTFYLYDAFVDHIEYLLSIIPNGFSFNNKELINRYADFTSMLIYMRDEVTSYMRNFKIKAYSEYIYELKLIYFANKLNLQYVLEYNFINDIKYETPSGEIKEYLKNSIINYTDDDCYNVIFEILDFCEYEEMFEYDRKSKDLADKLSEYIRNNDLIRIVY